VNLLVNGPGDEVGFARLDESLREVHADTGAAEAHGIMCGVLCAGAAPREDWMRQILHAGRRGEWDTGDGRHLLLAVYEETRRQLLSPGFEFHPLWPDDDEPLEERSAALGTWCGGFLSGLGLAGLGNLGELPCDSRDVIADLSKFSTIRGSDGADESEETAYAELVEYVRVGVMLVREELGAERWPVPSERNRTTTLQ